MTFELRTLAIDQARLKTAATAAEKLQIQWIELSRPPLHGVAAPKPKGKAKGKAKAKAAPDPDWFELAQD